MDYLNGVSAEELPALKAGILALAASAPGDDLDRMLAELASLAELPPVDQIRTLRRLAADAPGALSRRADAVTERLAGPGRPMTITALAAELDVSRGKVNEAAARARAARMA